VFLREKRPAARRRINERISGVDRDETEKRAANRRVLVYQVFVFPTHRRRPDRNVLTRVSSGTLWKTRSFILRNTLACPTILNSYYYYDTRRLASKTQ